MKNNLRRDFLKKMAIAPALSTIGISSFASSNNSPAEKENRLKMSLNAFSFNKPLSEGNMTIDDMLEFCAENRFDAVDITAYYFPGYPNVPDDDFLYHVKKKAFKLGLEISGTGVRNDFTIADKSKRQEGVQLVKNWIDAAEKIGAPVIRVFAGHGTPDGYKREQVVEWMVEDLKTCTAYGKAHGVVVAVQNHHDFILTADQAIEIIKKVDSEWFGLILDTGSYRTLDAYAEIEKSIPYAVNWQLKENIFVDGKEVPTDLKRIAKIIKASNYNGYLPIETLGEGDPKTKIKALIAKVREAIYAQ